RGSAMARILILGGAGFVGYHLARRLAETPSNRITLVDDLSRGRADVELTALLARPSVELVRADLTDPAALTPLPTQWDQVHVLAAVVGVRPVTGAPARVVRVNTLATLNVLEWAAPGAGGEIVNIANATQETTVADLLALVLRTADFTPRLQTLPAPAESVARRCPDLTKLRALTGYVPKVGLEAGVRDTFAWYRAWRERGRR